MKLSEVKPGDIITSTTTSMYERHNIERCIILDNIDELMPIMIIAIEQLPARVSNHFYKHKNIICLSAIDNQLYERYVCDSEVDYEYSYDDFESKFKCLSI